MGNGLCGNDAHFSDHSIFDYRYGEDKMDQNIIHNDSIQCSNLSLKPSLVDCETKLKRSEKRFKDTTINTDPVVLICGDKQVRCSFQRPQAFLKREGVLITNKIYKILDKANSSPSNVFVGDQVLQYFGVFLCYLASNPELIDRIILTKPNSYGICAIQMIIEGKKEFIFIDDYILCKDGIPLFSKPIKYIDMWPCLLQKAWFKVKSCLKNKIQKINPIEVFQSFLSYPIKHVQLTESYEANREIVRKELKNAHSIDSNFGCVVTSKLRPTHKIGLTGRRHFYFLRAIEYRNKTYYYLRNPVGAFQVFDFRGSLLEIPTQLQDHIVKVTGQPIANGNFLLTEEEFDEQIESFFFIFYSPSSPIITEELINFKGNLQEEVYIKFHLKKSGSVGLRLQQLTKDEVCTPITHQLIDVDRKSLVSGQVNDVGCFGVAETNLLTNMHQVLMPGNYILRIKKKPNAQTASLIKSKQSLLNTNKDRLILSANEEVAFQQSSTGQVKKEFESTLKEIAKKELAMSKSPVRDQIEQIVVWMGDLVLVYANKLNTVKSAINLQVYFPELKNLECLSHKISKGYTSLPPFPKDELIIFEKISLTDETLLGTYSLTPY